MTDDKDNYLADLTTAPIFDDSVFLTEALKLPDCQNEDLLDAHVILAAEGAGIQDPYRFLCPDLVDISTAVSTLTVSSAHRSSMSIHSRETQSTGITSHPSRTSKDSHGLEGSPVPRAAQLARASVSSDDHYDVVMNRFRPSARHRPPSSTVSATNPVFSAPSSPAKPTPRKQKRTSRHALFSMFRRDSSSCPSRAHHGHQAKPSNPKLECGHALSDSAIRIHIQEAINSKERTAPNCCGKPLPRSILETVLSTEEAAIVATTEPPSPAIDSLKDSGYGEGGTSSMDFPRSMDTPFHPARSFVSAPDTPCRNMTREEEERMVQALDDETFKSLKAQQNDEYRDVAYFEANQRKALSALHQWTLAGLTSELEFKQTEMRKQHALELERLDESQIAAEHDLRKAHAQETQNVATAMKYMSAYCSGTNPIDPTIEHTVTEEDRKKLARQHLTQQKLPAKHESAINVLRARQEKETETKLQKQEAELDQLRLDFERQKRDQEMQYIRDSSRLGSLIEARRTRVIRRWDLRFETWKRDWETQHGTTLRGRLPHGAWPETPTSTLLDPSSSLALYLQIKS